MDTEGKERIDETEKRQRKGGVEGKLAKGGKRQTKQIRGMGSKEGLFGEVN